MKKRKKIISLNHKLNKTQHDIFCKFADPFKKKTNDEYNKINAINNVDNNINYYIYKNKRNIDTQLPYEKIPNKINKSKNELSPYKEISTKYESNKKELINTDNNNNNLEEKILNKLILTSNNNIYNRNNSSNYLEFNKLSKPKNDFNKIIKGILDKELVNNNINNINNEEYKNSMFKRIKNCSSDKLMNKLNMNMYNNKNKVYYSVKADNKIINNCIIKKKMVYDIKPLNKLKEKGRCNFSKELTENNNKIESTSLTRDSLKSNNIPFNYSFQNKNYDDYNLNKNINIFKKENNKEEIINIFSNIMKSRNTFNDKINNNIKTEGNIHSKSTSNINNSFYTENLEINKNDSKRLNNNFDLKKLYKDIPNYEKSKNIYMYYKDGVSVTRGEKLKFLKTTYPINLIKPLETQKALKLKFYNNIEIKKEKLSKKFSINHYNLDILNRNNQKLIKDMNCIQNDLCDKIKNEFTYFYNSINDKKFNDII